MLDQLKKFFKKKFTITMNLIVTLARVLHKPYAKHRGDVDVKYNNIEISIRDDNSVCDRSTAFYFRVILQYKHETVIEIGAYDGSRILEVKRCLPEIEAFGVDIGPKYRRGFEHNGVKFSEFNFDFFNNSFPKPLVVCNCTLNYFKPRDLKDFLNVLRKEGYAIAFCEPVPHFTFDETLKRSQIAYYHPYKEVFRECGFTLEEKKYFNAIHHSFSTSMREFTYANYAYVGTT